MVHRVRQIGIGFHGVRIQDIGTLESDPFYEGHFTGTRTVHFERTRLTDPFQDHRIRIGLDGIKGLYTGQALLPEGQLLQEGGAANKNYGFQCEILRYNKKMFRCFTQNY
jgi:hypothetical protein